MKLGHPATKLSGDESQRIKPAHPLARIQRGRHSLYIPDEPAAGLHLAGIQKLLGSLNRLVNAGHTVVVIKHHLDAIKTADTSSTWGPRAITCRHRAIAGATPEEIAQVAGSHTDRYLAEALG